MSMSCLPGRQAFGAPVLCAAVARAYVDLNRDPAELDPPMFFDPPPRAPGRPRSGSKPALACCRRSPATAKTFIAAGCRLAEAERRLDGGAQALSCDAGRADRREPGAVWQGRPARLPFDALERARRARALTWCWAIGLARPAIRTSPAWLNRPCGPWATASAATPRSRAATPPRPMAGPTAGVHALQIELESRALSAGALAHPLFRV
jgi:hypothetical protein